MAGDADRFAVETDFAFVGRTFSEYRRLFALDPETLGELSVLDCPGGPSSFTAVAAELGATALAVDPAYDPLADALAGTSCRAIDRVVDALREDGYTVRFRGVPYEFQPGATEMLVVSD